MEGKKGCFAVVLLLCVCVVLSAWIFTDSVPNVHKALRARSAGFVARLVSSWRTGVRTGALDVADDLLVAVHHAWPADAGHDTTWSWPVVISQLSTCGPQKAGATSTPDNATLAKSAALLRQVLNISASSCRRNSTVTVMGMRLKVFVVLRWARLWNSQRVINPVPTPFHYCRQCRTVLFYTSDRDMLACADIVEFHDTDTQLRDLPPRGFPQQLFMVMSWESPIRGHSHLTDDGLMGQYNLLRTYRRDSDLFFSYFPSCIMRWMRRPVKPFAEREPNAIMFITSNCNAENMRQDYVRDLMTHADVHSYGRCLHNRELPDNDDGAMVARYKFYIAIENSICLDYVTEKLVRGWRHGVIPIVTGYEDKPDFRHFAPNSHSLLNVNTFRSTAKLAERVKEIAADENLFNSFLSYRTDPGQISDDFKRMFAPPDDSDPEGWCKLVQRMQKPGNLANMTKRVLTGDHSCVPKGTIASAVKEETASTGSRP
ncbi:alpha-(1,3)-fucosyltransferase C-like [Sycon ciliatum]|uniref:alpha-(1,3)-fucosyltransferase C-like n=1 Tax=Sycon ciliatum TaxID=27933 RepID=UPI0031F65759